MKYFIGTALVLIGLPLMAIPFVGHLLSIPLLLLGVLFLASALSTSNAKKTARETAKALAVQVRQVHGPDSSTASPNSGDADRKWGVLCEVDMDLRQAAERVQRLGPAAQHELKTKFMTLNDKRYLNQIVQVIEAKYLR